MNMANSLNNILSAWKTYMTSYTDDLGMFCLYPYEGNYDNENPHLFTGEMNVLLNLLKLSDPKMPRDMNNFLAHTQVVPGLHRRRHDTDISTVSHDEYSGIMFFTLGNKQALSYVGSIVEYGKENGWQYHDRRPYVNGIKYAIKHPIKTYKYFKRLSRGDESAREEYPKLDALSYIRQPRDIAFYKIISPNHKPNLFELTYLAISIIMSAVRNPKYKNGGTKLIAWYRLKTIEYYGMNRGVIKIAHKYLIRKMKKQYGKNYLTNIHKLYFKDKNHPIHTLIKEYDEIQNRGV